MITHTRFKVRLRHPMLPGKFLVCVTELTEKHAQSITRLTVKHGLTMQEGMELAAMTNIVMQQPDLIPVDVVPITREEFLELIASKKGEEQ